MSNPKINNINVGGVNYDIGTDADDAVEGILMIGAKNILPNKMTNTVVTSNGVTCSCFADGSIVLNGTATEDTIFQLTGSTRIPINRVFPIEGRYKIVTNLIDGTQAMVFIGCWHDNSWVAPNQWVGKARASAAIKSFDITKTQIDGGTDYSLEVSIKVFSGETYDRERVTVMIMPDSISDETYTPYTPTNHSLIEIPTYTSRTLIYYKTNEIVDEAITINDDGYYRMLVQALNTNIGNVQVRDSAGNPLISADGVHGIKADNVIIPIKANTVLRAYMSQADSSSYIRIYKLS